MNLREVVKERRGVLGISQIDLAEMAGISLATVKDIERGAGNPSMKNDIAYETVGSICK